jgi:hypothetical protein
MKKDLLIHEDVITPTNKESSIQYKVRRSNAMSDKYETEAYQDK